MNHKHVTRKQHQIVLLNYGKTFKPLQTSSNLSFDQEETSWGADHPMGACCGHLAPSSRTGHRTKQSRQPLGQAHLAAPTPLLKMSVFVSFCCLFITAPSSPHFLLRLDLTLCGLVPSISEQTSGRSQGPFSLTALLFGAALTS